MRFEGTEWMLCLGVGQDWGWGLGFTPRKWTQVIVLQLFAVCHVIVKILISQKSQNYFRPYKQPNKVFYFYSQHVSGKNHLLVCRNPNQYEESRARCCGQLVRCPTSFSILLTSASKQCHCRNHSHAWFPPWKTLWFQMRTQWMNTKQIFHWPLQKRNPKNLFEFSGEIYGSCSVTCLRFPLKSFEDLPPWHRNWPSCTCIIKGIKQRCPDPAFKIMFLPWSLPPHQRERALNKALIAVPKKREKKKTTATAKSALLGCCSKSTTVQPFGDWCWTTLCRIPAKVAGWKGAESEASFKHSECCCLVMNVRGLGRVWTSPRKQIPLVH